MKPSAFAYHRPETVDEAIAILRDEGEDTKVLAGGQSLIPMLNMRLVMPGALVDINRIAELRSLQVTNGGVEIGAGTRQHEVQLSAEVGAACPLLPEALSHVSHRVIRGRGTVVGSLTHADPAAELPAVLALLDGTIVARGPEGERSIPARDFFVGFLETALQPDELAVSATFPALTPGRGAAVVEFSRRHGDFALCGVAAVADRGSARIAVFGVDTVPRVFDVPDAAEGSDEALDEIARGLHPSSDIHASAAFRRRLVRVLGKRAMEAAAAQASTRNGGRA